MFCSRRTPKSNWVWHPCIRAQSCFQLLNYPLHLHTNKYMYIHLFIYLFFTSQLTLACRRSSTRRSGGGTPSSELRTGWRRRSSHVTRTPRPHMITGYFIIDAGKTHFSYVVKGIFFFERENSGSSHQQSVYLTSARLPSKLHVWDSGCWVVVNNSSSTKQHVQEAFISWDVFYLFERAPGVSPLPQLKVLDLVFRSGRWGHTGSWYGLE